MGRANLSRDYFTNRQDRYHLFKSRELTDYYALFHESLRSISYKLKTSTREEKFSLDWPKENVPPFPQFIVIVSMCIDFRDVQNHISRLKNTEPMPLKSFPRY